MRKIVFLAILTVMILAPVCTAQAADTLPEDDPSYSVKGLPVSQIYTCTCGNNCREYPYTGQTSGGEKDVGKICPATCKVQVGVNCPTIEAGTCRGNECVKLENPIRMTDGEISVPTLIGNIIKGFLTVIGSLALLMIVWGGFQWLTSMGNQEKVKSGTKTMLWATIGLVVVFASYLLVANVFALLQPVVVESTEITAE